MIRTDEERAEGPDPLSDRRLWQRSRVIDAPEDEAARFLDLAAFADGRLDAEDQDRVAALLAADPDAAADVRSARMLDGTEEGSTDLEPIIARACAILPGADRPDADHPDADQWRGRVIVLALRRSRRPLVQSFAQWGSIAAAIAVASWLGFAMGSDASLALSNPRQPSDAGFLPELFDPANSFLRDLGESLRT
jgi:anti-sigma factor RsiW